MFSVIRCHALDLGSARQHLKRLSVSDRYLRFCTLSTDDMIDEYVNGITLEYPNAVFAVFDNNQIVGMAHVASVSKDSAELAFSVDEQYRGKGICSQLFDRVVLHARASGITHLFMNCLSSNTAIKHLAQKNSMSLVTDYGECVARLNVSDVTRVAAWVEEVCSDTLALYDMRCKDMRSQWDAYVEHMQSLCGEKQ